MTLPHGLLLAGSGRTPGGPRGTDFTAHVAARMAPQVASLAVGGGSQAIPDTRRLDAPAGSIIACVLAGLDWAAGEDASELVTAPANAVFLPARYVMALRMASHAYDAPLVVAEAPDADGTIRTHPRFALWPVAARARLQNALAAGETDVLAVLRAGGAARISFGSGPLPPFFTPETLEATRAAERLIAEPGA
jgi:molybdenum cofactor guanylyltransferase